MYLRLSKAVSVVLHPFLVPLYMVSLLLLAGTVYSLYPLKVKIYLIWVTLLFTTIIPVLVIALLKSYRKIGDADLSDRKERFIPLLAMIACYTLCAVAIARIPSAQMLSRFMFAGACCVAVCLFVSFYWKISLHMTALGAAVAFIVLINIASGGGLFAAFIAALLAAGALGSARLKRGIIRCRKWRWDSQLVLSSPQASVCSTGNIYEK